MDRDLIEMDIKEAIRKVVDTLENHNSDAWRPEGFMDGRIPVSYTHLRAHET